MRSRLEIELDRLDSSVPFYATPPVHVHHTWARTFHSLPELVVRPRSIPEVQKAITLARRLRRRLCVVGAQHSPSDLTCTSAWLLNLDGLADVLEVRPRERVARGNPTTAGGSPEAEWGGVVRVQAGIRLRDLNRAANARGLTLRNMGSIDEQSVAGALATGTHGSSLRHGLLSQSVRSLRLVLANGRCVACSRAHNPELFRAALVSLGALGVVVEVELELAPAGNVAWRQALRPLSEVLADWDGPLWRSAEFTRVWWLPYTERAVVWRGERTGAAARPLPAHSWYGGSVGYHTYHLLLLLAHYVPRVLPLVERFVFGMQYGFAPGDTTATSAVEPMQTALLMNCLYSQYVNEWAIPLGRGPEAIRRLSTWIGGDAAAARIPVDPAGVYVHAPIEVRVSDTSADDAAARPLLSPTCPDGPSLHLNATLYRPFGRDPPGMDRYYAAFEYLMKELGGRPHWAKNFATVGRSDVERMYGEDLRAWRRVRAEVDPDGMFVGAWHRRVVLEDGSVLLLEEKEVMRRRWRGDGGGVEWFGKKAVEDAEGVEGEKGGVEPRSSGSEESFDLMAGAEAEASVMLHSMRIDYGDEEEEDGEVGEMLTRNGAEEGVTGVHVFDKM